MKKTILTPLLGLAVVAAAALALAWPREQFIPARSAQSWASTPANIARGAYLARAGDCAACHTERGGAAYAGGRAIDTPFGRLYGPNITPDRATGIGAWTADEFWGALHNGKSRDGRLLYPAFPYPNYTRVSRADADALFAYLRSLPPQRKPNRPHELRFPYDQQAVLAGWRLLYFTPGVFEPDARRDAAWNRGAYLVEGLGHCAACHSPRNGLGATEGTLSGGMIPVAGWYAPSLMSGAAGLGNWEAAQIVQLLHTGTAADASVTGPMAEVVARSLQHLSREDIGAMAAYLKSLPATPAAAGAPRPQGPDFERIAQAGRQLYEHHCADCHGSDGKGRAPAYPRLAGNRSVSATDGVNAIRIVLNGGFAPATQGNPRPYGMPSFGHLLRDDEAAALLTYVRTAWGNGGGIVTPPEVNRYRAVPLD